jgi:uncharacterized protein
VTLKPLPPFAAWRHRDAREGFEIVFLTRLPDGYRLEGGTTAVEDGAAWKVDYRIDLDANWLTRGARVVGRSEAGPSDVRIDADGLGSWMVNGAPRPDLQGCLDLDLESSSLTNALPVHRLGLQVGEAAEAPAVYLHAQDLSVERLDQHYHRVDDEGVGQRYDYAAPRFDYRERLTYDASGLILTYPGLAERFA